MERISGEFKIDFKIIEGPEYPLTHKALSETEGELLISAGSNVLFKEQGILLAEFASELNRWLANRDRKADFIYSSMDYEEAPILKFEDLEDEITIFSGWSGTRISVPVLVDRASVIAAAKLFLGKLEGAIPGITEVF